MLAMIREYGQERLAGTGEEPRIRARHRDYYQSLVARAEADQFGPRRPEWLHRLELELPM